MNVEDSSIDLLTVCQAVHWFDLDTFYQEVKRVLKPNGIVALYGYDFLYDYFHPNIRILDESYRNLPFPFQNVTKSHDKHVFEMKSDLNHLGNWFKTWSGWQEFRKKNGEASAEKLIQDFLSNATKHLKGSKITITVDYFAIMGSK